MFPDNISLTEAMARLDAINEHRDLGSGALLRDLERRRGQPA
ncbi:MAG: hypothetical protein ACLTQI_09815 [Slackia sp.]